MVSWFKMSLQGMRIEGKHEEYRAVDKENK